MFFFQKLLFFHFLDGILRRSPGRSRLGREGPLPYGCQSVPKCALPGEATIVVVHQVLDDVGASVHLGVLALASRNRLV